MNLSAFGGFVELLVDFLKTKFLTFLPNLKLEIIFCEIGEIITLAVKNLSTFCFQLLTNFA